MPFTFGVDNSLLRLLPWPINNLAYISQLKPLNLPLHAKVHAEHLLDPWSNPSPTQSVPNSYKRPHKVKTIALGYIILLFHLLNFLFYFHSKSSVN